jgi:hypothetical protein
MKIKYYLLVVALVIVTFEIFLYFQKKSFDRLNGDISKLESEITNYQLQIDSLSNQQDSSIKIIDSLIAERQKVKILYKTIYEKYSNDTILVNSFSVDSIQKFWANRYK